MRIAYLINGLNGGGAAFPMVKMLGLMRELGHSVRVIALMPQDMKAAAGLERAGIPFEVIGGGIRDIVGPAIRLVGTLRADRPDLLWTSLSRGAIYGQILGPLLDLPVISWQHSAFLKPLNLALLRRTGGRAKRWIADSDSVSAFTQRSIGIAPDRISVWTPFVSDPSAPVATPWDRRSALRLGTLGRLHHSKQYAVLLRAFARAREIDPVLGGRIELWIAGDGPEESMLRELATTLSVSEQVRFLGFVERPTEFLALLHGYVQTSLKEGFCLAAHEAMQAGLAVIATRVGQLAYSVRPGETGWLCDVGATEQLANAILDWASDSARSTTYGLAARAQILERYSAIRFRTAGEDLLRSIAVECHAGDEPAGSGDSAGKRPS